MSKTTFSNRSASIPTRLVIWSSVLLTIDFIGKYGIKISEVQLVVGIEDQPFCRFKTALDEGAVNQRDVTLFGS
ncbi:hypothetical protein [Candidatus Enterococcus courvalinii]|uniref:Uncharacterized protein n=1 Tax=Candidatus Enterococcus courvalinii TaxID=2815329 RepID=A0ABS3HXD4_9ENTE|nr:hypothetical protein [Enterococcus sp. MSG2901]MBO0481130.1 hypothetical protein [Enterococcus sp. MSG2901]